MEKTTDDNLKPVMSGSSMDEAGGSGSSIQQKTETPATMGGEGIEIEKEVETPSLKTPCKAVEPRSGGYGGMPATKGYGLKKWRRIKRDSGKDGGGGTDLNRILKRGLSITEPVKSRDPSGNNRQKSEGSGSVASANSAMKNMVFSASLIGGSDSESRLAVGISFPAGTDSENSEDRSSKSTAASAPKLRLEMPLGAGSTKEKGKVKNPSGRVSISSTHKSQQGKGKAETIKKFREERVRAEKENSHSSAESNLRSSSAAFMLASGFSGVGDGRQRDRLLNYNGENSDEVHVSEPRSSEEAQADYYKENGEEVVSKDAAADVSGEEEKKESQGHNPSISQDPLVKSIVLLQSVQTALEKEVKEFGEIGKDFTSVLNGSSHGVGASHRVLFEETKESESTPSQSRMIRLTNQVNYLQHKLAAISVVLKAKESEVLALESILNIIQLPGCVQDQTVLQEQEFELDDLFKKRIEAEVESLIMMKTTPKVEVIAEDKISLFGEQKSLVEEQEQMLLKLREAKNKGAMLRMQADELEASCKELLDTTEILRMQSDVCKNSLCFLIQLVLLCIVFGLFLLHLLPHSTGFVPT